MYQSVRAAARNAAFKARMIAQPELQQPGGTVNFIKSLSVCGK